MSSNRAKLIAQGKTLIQPLSWRSRWWPSLKKRFDLLIMLGVIAVIVSIILIAIPLGFLQTAGIALLATALSLISSTITGRQAVHQQFAKDANLVRKNESYAPLQEELNKLHDFLKAAHEGTEPYPAWIQGAEKEPEKAKYQQHKYNPATFKRWSEFKRNYHAGHFSREAHSILDEVFRLATAYNAAIALTHQPSINALTKPIATAVQAVTKEREIGNVISSILPGSILGHDIAVSWIESDGALEWLVTGNLDRAVSSIYNSYRLHMSKPPGHSWIQAILQAAWPELREQAHYSEVRVALELLFKQVGIAKKKLEDGLLYIRDTYEGGAPPV